MSDDNPFLMDATPSPAPAAPSGDNPFLVSAAPPAASAGAPGPLFPGVGIPQQTIDPSIFANADAKESAAYSANPVAAAGNDVAGLVSPAPGMVRGLPFGDRAEALGSSIVTGKPYDESLSDIRNTAANNPSEKTQNIAGGVASAIVPVGGLGAAASTIGKIGMGALGGGVMGGAYGLSSTPDLTQSVGQDVANTAKGAIPGAAIGAVIPAAGAALGAAAQKAVSWFRPQVGSLPATENTLLYRAMGPEGGSAIGQKLGDLGPQANLMDASGGALKLGQGVTGALGLDNAAITKPLAERAAGTNTRLTTDVNTAMGPAPPSAQIASDAMQAQIKPYSQAQQTALAQAPPVDISPVIQTIDSKLANISPGIPLAAELRKIRSSLTETSAPPPPPPASMSAAQFQQYQAQAANAGNSAPITNAQQIDSVRQYIDGNVNWKGGGLGPLEGMTSTQQGILKDIRGEISDSLKSQIPDYRSATESIAQLKQQQQAILDGSKSLGGGQNAINPNDFAAGYGPAAVGPVQPGMLPPRTPNQAATNVGMRATVDQRLGTSPNDFSALKGMMQGSADPESGIGAGYNSTNIGQAFGPQAESGIQAALNRENAFSNTNTKITGNSETAGRQAMTDALKAAVENKPLISGHATDVTTHGLILGPAKAAINAIASPFQGHVDAPTVYRNLAGALTAPGDRARQLLADALQSGANTANNKEAGKSVAYLANLAQALGAGGLAGNVYSGGRRAQ